jgi:hypothetical protein
VFWTNERPLWSLQYYYAFRDLSYLQVCGEWRGVGAPLTESLIPLLSYSGASNCGAHNSPPHWPLRSPAGKAVLHSERTSSLQLTGLTHSYQICSWSATHFWTRVIILWRIDPLLGTGPVNISQQHTIAFNNRTSIARQPSGTQPSSTLQAVFSVGSIRSLYNDSL